MVYTISTLNSNTSLHLYNFIVFKVFLHILFPLISLVFLTIPLPNPSISPLLRSKTQKEHRKGGIAEKAA